MKYAWIEKHSGEFETTLACKVLHVGRSGFYDWRNREPSERAKKRQVVAEQAERFHARSHGIYGYRKVHRDITEETDIHCGDELVRLVMREKGLRARCARKFVRTTDSKHSLPVAENILNRNFHAADINQKWVADITYIRTHEDWLYLAGIMDLHSRRIIGWAMSDRIDSALVCDAMKMAITHRCPGPDLIHHSDRGVQYASDDFQRLLDRHGIECSMSRKGNCWDNASKESFFGKLKSEWIQGRVYRTKEEAKQDVFWYIEVFYNRMRRHASLGYVSPVDFEAREKSEEAA